MQNAKPIEFHAGAGQYFIFTILSIILTYIPILGWALLLNYSGNWFADKTKVNGKSIAYSASYGESLMFVFVNTLLIFITFGIYSFWFYPKLYSYMADHTSYAEEVVATPPVATPTVDSTLPPVTPVAS